MLSIKHAPACTANLHDDQVKAKDTTTKETQQSPSSALKPSSDSAFHGSPLRATTTVHRHYALAATESNMEIYAM